ncbi:MAG: Hsp20 family protein [Bacteroidetes bacterium]|jgi:HSP20 family protein|nr:Hsp20 family protein [Bacteroidota bacterium]
MTLLQYNRPGSTRTGKHFSDIMDEFFNEAVAGRATTFSPSINISETEDQFSIEVEVPGLNKEDLNINVENSTLTISGERKKKSEEDGRRFHRVETHYGTFNRSFQLPDYVDQDSIEATYKNGILDVTMNKREEKLKKQISIQ